MKWVSLEVKGNIDQRWLSWFEGLTLDYLSSGNTLMAGRLPDMAAVYGVIEQVRNMGLDTIAIHVVTVGREQEIDGRECDRRCVKLNSRNS